MQLTSWILTINIRNEQTSRKFWRMSVYQRNASFKMRSKQYAIDSFSQKKFVKLLIFSYVNSWCIFISWLVSCSNSGINWYKTIVCRRSRTFSTSCVQQMPCKQRRTLSNQITNCATSWFSSLLKPRTNVSSIELMLGIQTYIINLTYSECVSKYLY